MDRKFNNTVPVLDRLIWKCDMCDLEIRDTYDSMDKWLASNVDSEKFQWYSPPYTKGASKVEHNGIMYDACICFEFKEDSDAFRARFGVVR